jgi:hypothetical protein
VLTTSVKLPRQLLVANSSRSSLIASLIGAGIRTMPSKFFLLFEKLVNVVHETRSSSQAVLQHESRAIRRRRVRRWL